MYLQKYAMQFGTYMGVYWILKFILFPLGLSLPFFQFLFIGLTIGVPFMGYYYARMYRDRVCGGYINFMQAWLFTLFMYMFAALLVAVAHYVYFQFIDHGHILSSYEKLIQQSLDTPNLPADTKELLSQLKSTVGVIEGFTPIEITMQLISNNVLWGSILAIPTALLVKRRRKDNNSK